MGSVPRLGSKISHVCVPAKSLSRVRLFVTLWTVARQTPLSMGFSRQEPWSGLPWPPPGDLPNPGMEATSLTSPALADSFFITGTVVQRLKRPHAVWETWVRSLGWEDPLEKGMAARSSILAWRVPWTEEPGGLHY